MQPALPIRNWAPQDSIFNPHPATGCNREGDVSILIRPEGRMQPAPAHGRRHATAIRFNPHPARRPDATVPFQSSTGLLGAAEVSILIRPEGRMQPFTARRSWPLPLDRFNPHPARRPDATAQQRADEHDAPFQSSSGQKAGCNCRSNYSRGISTVSILIRPEGRMQRGHFAVHVRTYLLVFQSSSGQKAGCNPRWLFPGCNGQSSWSAMFQSSSGQKAGCNTAACRARCRSFTFQSSSGQKAGCNGNTHLGRPNGVSILIRPEGRMQP